MIVVNVVSLSVSDPAVTEMRGAVSGSMETPPVNAMSSSVVCVAEVVCRNDPLWTTTLNEEILTESVASLRIIPLSELRVTVGCLSF